MSTFAFYEIDDDGEPVSDETTFTAAGTLTNPADRSGIYAAFENIVGSKVDDEAEWLNSRNVIVRDGRSFNLWQVAYGEDAFWQDVTDRAERIGNVSVDDALRAREDQP